MLFLKVVQVFNHYLMQTQVPDPVRNQAIATVGAYLLPALCVARDLNPMLDNEMWQIMKKIDPTTRYKFYQ